MILFVLMCLYQLTISTHSLFPMVTILPPPPRTLTLSADSNAKNTRDGVAGQPRRWYERGQTVAVTVRHSPTGFCHGPRAVCETTGRCQRLRQRKNRDTSARGHWEQELRPLSVAVGARGRLQCSNEDVDARRWCMGGPRSDNDVGSWRGCLERTSYDASEEGHPTGQM